MKMTNRKPIIDWLLKHFPAAKREEFKLICLEWFQYIDRQIECKGALHTIKMLKGMRNHVTKYLAGTPVLNSIEIGISLTKDGLPKRVHRMVKLIRSGDTWDLRFVMTLLLVSRDIPGWKPVDLDPIVTAPKAEITNLEIDEIANLVRRYQQELIPTEFEKFHITSKMGPQGLALDYAIEDLKLLPESGIAKDIVLLGGETLKDKMNIIFGLLDEVPISPQSKRSGDTLRRLSIKEDKEGKSRVFAILDYWSQTTLKRLHNEVLTILRSIKVDCTFDQGSRLGRIRPNPYYHSIDLTNATDRFPIKLQIKVLELLIGKDKSEAWGRIMVGLPFVLKGTPVLYGTGQPMGAFSSWPVFALSHHLVIQHAAKLVGHTDYRNYMLLGDDVVLGDEDVANSYLQVLNRLGVETSPYKSHVSKTTYEFAKRWIHNGVEITGIPLTSVLHYQGPGSVLAWLTVIERNWHLPHQTYSRSDFVRLLQAIGLKKEKIRLESLRLWESRLLPLAKVDFNSQEERCYRTYQYLLPDMVRCNGGWERVYLTLIQFIPMVKIKIAGIAIKDTVKAVTQYVNKLVRSVAAHPDFNKELLSDLPQLIRLLPVVEVSMAYAINAQLQLDKMEDLVAEAREEAILQDPPVIGFNPLKIESRDRDNIMFFVHSKIPKELKQANKDFLAMRAEVLEGFNPTEPWQPMKPKLEESEFFEFRLRALGYFGNPSTVTTFTERKTTYGS